MNLPPVVQVLMDEDLSALSSYREASARLRAGLYRDLKRQAEWTFHNYETTYESLVPGSDEFVVTASGAINPFASEGPCTAPGCRFSRVPAFLQTVGVWADRVYVPDVFSMELRDVGRLRRQWVERFVAHANVLRALVPLINAGVIRFANPSFAYCEDCKTRVPAHAAAQLVADFEREFSFELHDEWLMLQSETVLDGAIVEFYMPEAAMSAAESLVRNQKRKRLPKEAQALRRALVGQYLRDQVGDVFLDLLAAQRARSVVVSGSRTDLLCLKAIEHELPELSSLEAWESAREVKVPWLSELSAAGVLALRDEAATALPRFRERFARGMATGAASDPQTTVLELRAEAAEVEAELKALAPRARQRERASIALLSTGVALYGVAALGVPAASGAAQLLTTLGLIHGLARSDRTEEAKLKTRPGYVLVKAKELLAHGGANHRAG